MNRFKRAHINTMISQHANVFFPVRFFLLLFQSVSFSMNPTTSINSFLAMESDYEATLADYSLQDSPFYEANTPIFFNLSSTSAAIAYSATRSAAMTDALNLTAKKMMRDGSCRTSTDGGDHSNESLKMTAADGGDRKPFGMANGLFSADSMNGTATAATAATHNADINGAPAKKKRKCVTFLPSYVQVSECGTTHAPQSAHNVPFATTTKVWSIGFC